MVGNLSRYCFYTFNVDIGCGDDKKDARSLLITSHFDPHRGAVALIRVVDGVVKKEKMGLSKLLCSNGHFSKPSVVSVKKCTGTI